jgi:elongation factor P hydroxylase
MSTGFTDDEWCQFLISALASIFPKLTMLGGAEEPYYSAPKVNAKAVIHFRSNYPRSLLHELSHYCLAGDKRRNIDDFGYWYSACGRSKEEQQRFEIVEVRPQGLEKAMCNLLGIKFSPSLDDFSGRPPSDAFLQGLEEAYIEMKTCPPPTAKKALHGLAISKSGIDNAIR